MVEFKKWFSFFCLSLSLSQDYSVVCLWYCPELILSACPRSIFLRIFIYLRVIRGLPFSSNTVESLIHKQYKECDCGLLENTLALKTENLDSDFTLATYSLCNLCWSAFSVILNLLLCKITFPVNLRVCVLLSHSPGL